MCTGRVQILFKLQLLFKFLPHLSTLPGFGIIKQEMAVMILTRT